MLICVKQMLAVYIKSIKLFIRLIFCSYFPANTTEGKCFRGKMEMCSCFKSIQVINWGYVRSSNSLLISDQYLCTNSI